MKHSTQFIKRNAETEEETGLKCTLEGLLRRRMKKPLLFSLMSRQFAYEWKELSKELLSTSTSTAPVKRLLKVFSCEINPSNDYLV